MIASESRTQRVQLRNRLNIVKRKLGVARYYHAEGLNELELCKHRLDLAAVLQNDIAKLGKEIRDLEAQETELQNQLNQLSN